MDESLHELLAQVASMYYDEELTQNQIAAQLDLSRVKIYRLLKQAKAENVVQITVNWPVKRAADLEQGLKEAFGLEEALVLKVSSQRHPRALQCLGQLGARYLERILTDGSTMAVCLGRTSYETINAISPNFQARVRVAQAVGSMPLTMQELDSAALARELARKLGGEVLYLTSPLMSTWASSCQRGMPRTNTLSSICSSKDSSAEGLPSMKKRFHLVGSTASNRWISILSVTASGL